MARQGDWFRRILYKTLPLTSYLKVLSKFFLVSFQLGLLRNNRAYDYPYFMDNVLSDGDVCIDIGANMGHYTLVFSKLVGRSGKVYAVEPVRPVLEVLRSNTKGRKNVEILPIALGNENKAIQLGNNTIQHKGFMASGRHTILEVNAEEGVVFEAQMKKGSEVFGRLERLDFIKCDIEGFEVVVLTEIMPVIEQHRPILLVEAGGDHRRQLIELFRAQSYECYMLEDGQLSPTRPSDQYDMLIIPDEKKAAFSSFI